MLRAGVDPQIVLDQTYNHLEVVGGASEIYRNAKTRGCPGKSGRNRKVDFFDRETHVFVIFLELRAHV